MSPLISQETLMDHSSNMLNGAPIALTIKPILHKNDDDFECKDDFITYEVPSEKQSPSFLAITKNASIETAVTLEEDDN